MPRKISNLQRRRRLAWRHRLVPHRYTNRVPEIADSLIALHSSDPATVYLSCACRMKSPAVEKIAKSIAVDRSVVRHHAMRRTIWVMSRDITRMAHAAATRKIANAQRKRTIKAFSGCREIKNAPKWYDRATEAIGQLLSEHGPMSAREVGQRLPQYAIPVEFGSDKYSAKLNAHTKILQGGGFDGVFVRGDSMGGWTSAEYSWSTAEDWLDDPITGVTEPEGARGLLECWLRQFGPATTTDIKWWFGWTSKLMMDSLASLDAQEVRLDNGTGWVLPGDDQLIDDPGSWVRLLPGLDATTMGWKQRDWYIDSEHVRPLFDQFGNAGPTIWADGRVVGGWIQRPDGTVAVQLLRKLTRKHQALLDEAIDEVKSFAGKTIVKPRFPASNQKQLLQ